MVPSRHAWAIRGYAVGSWMEADIHGGKNWVQGPLDADMGIDGEDQTWDVRSPPCVPGCTKPPMRPGCTPLFSEDGPIELAEWVIMWEENGKKR